MYQFLYLVFISSCMYFLYQIIKLSSDFLPLKSEEQKNYLVILNF